MKNKIIGILAAIIVALGGYSAADNLGAIGRGLVDLRVTKCETSTTSPSYFTGGTGTTTCLIYTGDAKQVGLNFLLNASSTSSVLEFKNFFSMDNGEGKNFFQKSNVAESGDTDTLTGEINQFSAVVAGDNVINVNVDNIRSDWLQVEYGVIGDNGAVYLEGITQNEQF